MTPDALQPSTAATPLARVAFVGAGPGEADLITLRGMRLLGQAKVVLYDALADPDLRAMAPQATWVDVGKRGFSERSEQQANGQARINELLIAHARQVGAQHGDQAWVVRLKGGDPSVFGRLEEELHALWSVGVVTQVVPGVTSALAAAAATQRPLTRRGVGRSVALITAMTRSGALCIEDAKARLADTEVYYMSGRQLGTLADGLQRAGWPPQTPVSVVSRAGWPDMCHSLHALVDLAVAAHTHAGRPTLVIVGAAAREVLADEPLPELVTPTCRSLQTPTNADKGPTRGQQGPHRPDFDPDTPPQARSDS